VPRMQITLHGTSTRNGATWAVTQQWAVGGGPANALAFQTALSTAAASLLGSAPFKAGIGTQYTMTGLHGLYYPIPLGPASIVADSNAVAVVVSERTNAAGPSFRGRSYWPCGAAGLDGVVSVATQNQVQSSWLAAHTLVSAALSGAGWSPVHCVFSRKTGDQTPISYIQTGNRIDTSRGRFGDAPEVYTAQALPTSASVAPSAVGLPDDADAEAIEKFEQFVNTSGDPAFLGPLKEVALGLGIAIVTA
jgi:hypothetical protein